MSTTEPELLEDMAAELLQTKAGKKRLTELLTRRTDRIRDLQEKLDRYVDEAAGIEELLAQHNQGQMTNGGETTMAQVTAEGEGEAF